MDKVVPNMDVALPAKPCPPADYPEFPGCRPVHILRREIKTYEGRIEFWDADTEIAMVCEAPTYYLHEAPGGRLAQLVTIIAQARGSQIAVGGSTNLLLRNERGEWQRLLQADQILFLSPREAVPTGLSVEVRLKEFPDVALEVDNTTDVRRGKLGLYESWGFPELWVEVPDKQSPSRPRSLRPGLTIYLQRESGFRAAPGSRAFPGWTAEEIHRALNEVEMSRETIAVLRRVGRAMGEAEGTGPDDDIFLREERREARAEGDAEGRAEMLRAILTQALESRSIPATPAILKQLARIDGASAAAAAAAMQAALTCRNEDDFLTWLSRTAD